MSGTRSRRLRRMTRTFTLTRGRLVDLLYMAFITAPRGQQGPQGRPFDDIRRDARVQEALHGVTRATDLDPPLDRTATATGGAAFSFSQSDWEWVLKLAETAPWGPASSLDVVELRDTISAAEKVNEKKPAR